MLCRIHFRDTIILNTHINACAILTSNNDLPETIGDNPSKY